MHLVGFGDKSIRDMQILCTDAGDHIVSPKMRAHTRGSASASGGSSSISIAISAAGTGDVGREVPGPTPPVTASVMMRKMTRFRANTYVVWKIDFSCQFEENVLRKSYKQDWPDCLTGFFQFLLLFLSCLQIAVKRVQHMRTNQREPTKCTAIPDTDGQRRAITLVLWKFLYSRKRRKLY